VTFQVRDAGTCRCHCRLAVHREAAFLKELGAVYGRIETYASAVCSDANSRHESSSVLDSQELFII